MENLKNKVLTILHWSEKYTKTDMVYLASGGFWLGMGQFVSSGAAFLTSIAFANLLPPETFGLYKYIISITSLLTITTLSGIDSAVTQAVARGFEGTLAVGIKTKIKWGFIGSLLSLIIATYYFSQGNPTLAIAFSVVSLFMPFSESFDMYNSLLFGKKLFNNQTIYNSIKKTIALIAIITTIFLTKNLYIILFVYFSSIVLPNLFFLYRTIKLHQKNKLSDSKAMTYGKHLSVVGIIGLVIGEIDKILIFHFLGATNLAIYALAVAPTDQIKGLLKNINALAMPQFSQRIPGEIKKTIWRKIWILILATSIIVFGYIIISPLFFEIFFPKYLISIYYSQILSLSLIPIVVAGFIYTILESQKAKKELYEYNFYTNIISIIVLFPLIYYFGIWGAIISRVVTRFFTFSVSVWLIKKII